MLSIWFSISQVEFIMLWLLKPGSSQSTNQSPEQRWSPWSELEFWNLTLILVPIWRSDSQEQKVILHIGIGPQTLLQMIFENSAKIYNALKFVVIFTKLSGHVSVFFQGKPLKGYPIYIWLQSTQDPPLDWEHVNTSSKTTK